MDADTLAKLFDPFFTTKRGSGGSGLGAHILYNLATNVLQGSLRVESGPGQGLRYHLRFPRKTARPGLKAA
jgi:signal transduction histidine kinase